MIKSKFINQSIHLTFATMHQTNNPQCTILQQQCVYYFLQNGILWDMGPGHCGICAFWFIQHLFLASKSKFLGIKRLCIKKTHTFEKEIRLLITAKWNTLFNQFWAQLHKGTKWAFLTWYFFTAFLSSILCNPVGVGMHFLTNRGM